MTLGSNNQPNSYESLAQSLRDCSHTWLVTGAAGFIGSNLVETLLNLNQRVVALDNCSTGHLSNLVEVKASVSENQWNSFRFINDDIRNEKTCFDACIGVDYVLHQAALGSVPRSVADPLTTNQVNISGFLNMLVAARDGGVKSFIYAASSSTYGDHPGLPKVEDQIGRPLSPYAVTKYVNELYAGVFGSTYGLSSIGLRYFNVFGKRQDPLGAYAAVIPKWINAMINNEDVYINGDGETSRDFCHVDNTVQANLLAALTTSKESMNQVYNVSVGGRITLNQLFLYLKEILITHGIQYKKEPLYVDFRGGDVRHSQADIGKITKYLAYSPAYSAYDGLVKAIPWYIKNAVGSTLAKEG